MDRCWQHPQQRGCESGGDLDQHSVGWVPDVQPARSLEGASKSALQLSIHVAACLPDHPPTYLRASPLPPFICLSPFIYPSMYLSVSSLHSALYLSTYLVICLSGQKPGEVLSGRGVFIGVSMLMGTVAFVGARRGLKPS